MPGQNYPKPVQELKLKAEDCMASEKYAEAFFHWTHALRLLPKEANFLDKRAKCFIATHNYNLALEDADELIGLGTEPKTRLLGHARKAEVYYDTRNFEDAARELQLCFQLSDPERKQTYFDMSIKSKRELSKQQTLDVQYPFVGAAVGILLAVAGVVLDYIFYGSKSFIAHPLLKVLVVLAVSGSCYGAATLMRDQMVKGRRALLEPPPDIFGLSESSNKKED